MSNDKTTTIWELKVYVEQFCKERDWDQFHNPKDLAKRIKEESDELWEHFENMPGEESHTLMKIQGKKGEISKELADLLYVLLRFGQKYDIDLTSTFYSKMEENANKYPVEKARGSNRKYTELK